MSASSKNAYDHESARDYRKTPVYRQGPTETHDHDDQGPYNSVSVGKVSEGGVRPTNEILTDILNEVKKLQAELEGSRDIGAKQSIQELAMTVGRRLGIRDEDGDVRMEGDAPMEEGEVTSAYRPASPPTEETLYVPKSPVERKLEGMEDQIDELQKVLREHMWQVTRDEVKLDDRLTALEGRLAVLEIPPNEEEEGQWTVVKSNRRRSPRESQDRPVTRGMLQRVEGRTEGVAKDFSALKKRVGGLEKSYRELNELRRKVAEVEGELTGVKKEAGEGDRKTSALEAKWEEIRLRQELVTRENGRVMISKGLPPRVSKLEVLLHEVNYRLDTLEAQGGWIDRIMGGIWLVTVANNPVDRSLVTAGLRTTWDGAVEYLRRRAEGRAALAPQLQTIPEERRTSTNDHAANIANAVNNHPPPITNNPASTY